MPAPQGSRNTQLVNPYYSEGQIGDLPRQRRVPFEAPTGVSAPHHHTSIRNAIPNQPQYEIFFSSLTAKFTIGQASDGHLVAIHEVDRKETARHRPSRPFEYSWRQGDMFFAARPYPREEYSLSWLPFSSSSVFGWGVLSSLLHEVRDCASSHISLTHALYQMLVAMQKWDSLPATFTFDLEAFVINSEGELAPYTDVEKAVVDWEPMSHQRPLEVTISASEWNHVLQELQHVARDSFARRQLSLSELEITVNTSERPADILVSELLKLSTCQHFEKHWTDRRTGTGIRTPIDGHWNWFGSHCSLAQRLWPTTSKVIQ